MTDAPMFIKIIVMLLMCGVCATVLVGLISQEMLAFKIAASCAALAVILVIGWRISQKAGGIDG